MVRRVALVALPLLLGLATPTPTWADHGGSANGPAGNGAVAAPLATEALSVPSPATLWPVLLVAAALLIVAIGSRRSRASVIAGLLLVFAFEGAIHSVHHLGDREGQSRCAVESASSHLSGVNAEPIEIEFSGMIRERVLLPDSVVASGHPPRADQQRAPPSVV